MSQQNQGNKQSEREGASHGHSNTPAKVSGIERVGGSSGVRFSVPSHPDLSKVKGPKS